MKRRRVVLIVLGLGCLLMAGAITAEKLPPFQPVRKQVEHLRELEKGIAALPHVFSVKGGDTVRIEIQAGSETLPLDGASLSGAPTKELQRRSLKRPAAPVTPSLRPRPQIHEIKIEGEGDFTGLMEIRRNGKQVSVTVHPAHPSELPGVSRGQEGTGILEAVTSAHVKQFTLRGERRYLYFVPIHAPGDMRIEARWTPEDAEAKIQLFKPGEYENCALWRQGKGSVTMKMRFSNHFDEVWLLEIASVPGSVDLPHGMGAGQTARPKLGGTLVIHRPESDRNAKSHIIDVERYLQEVGRLLQYHGAQATLRAEQVNSMAAWCGQWPVTKETGPGIGWCEKLRTMYSMTAEVLKQQHDTQMAAIRNVSN